MSEQDGKKEFLLYRVSLSFTTLRPLFRVFFFPRNPCERTTPKLGTGEGKPRFDQNDIATGESSRRGEPLVAVLVFRPTPIAAPAGTFRMQIEAETPAAANFERRGTPLDERFMGRCCARAPARRRDNRRSRDIFYVAVHSSFSWDVILRE